MKYTDGELIDINARSSQMLLDAAEFDECETLDDYKEAVRRLRQKAIDNASKARDSLN